MRKASLLHIRNFASRDQAAVTYSWKATQEMIPHSSRLDLSGQNFLNQLLCKRQTLQMHRINPTIKNASDFRSRL